MAELFLILAAALFCTALGFISGWWIRGLHEQDKGERNG
jgi:hypothetical protein